MDSHDLSGVGRGVSMPYFLVFGLAIEQEVQVLIYLLTVGECRDWWSTEAINHAVGASCFILDVEVELLQACGPLLMAVILQFYLCLHELQWLMISVNVCLLPKNVMSPLTTILHNGVHLFVISRVLTDKI
jgi:hypothetical protein